MKILKSQQFRVALLSSVSVAILGLSASALAAPAACIDNTTSNTHFRVDYPQQQITVSPGIQNVAIDASTAGNTLQDWSGNTIGTIPAFDSKHMLVINSDSGSMSVAPADPKCGTAPSPTPGPGPGPSPAQDKYSFQVKLPQAAGTDKLTATIIPLDSNGQQVKDQNGKPITFSAAGNNVTSVEHICGTWSPVQSLYLSTSTCTTTPQWLNKLSAQPTQVAVTVADTNDNPTNAYFKVLGTAQPAKLGGAIAVAAQGSPHTVNFQANQAGEKTQFTFSYLNDQGVSQFSAPFTLDFTQNQTESVALSFPTNSAQYKLSNGIVLTSFKNVKAASDDITTSTTQVPLTISEVSLPASLHVKSWPNYMAMGSVTAFHNIPTLNKRSFDDAIFKYAGFNGAGDAGVAPLTVWKKAQATVNTSNLAVALSARYGHPVVPVLVVYTTNASGGSKADAHKDLDDLTTLSYHYGYLALVANYLEKNPDPLFKNTYGSIVLNPDYLGEAHKDNLYDGVHPQVKQGLTDAFNYLATNGIITKAQAATYISQIPSSFGNDFKSYNQSLNWLVNTIAPHVSFGYADNVWAGDSAGHGWLHTAYQDPSQVTSHTNSEIAFLKSSGAYGNSQANLNPTYIAFDKYERNTISPSDHSVGGPYYYNANDWTVYMQYVGGISKAFDNKPVMLFQTPGAHLKTQGDTSTEEYGATAPDYILGNKALMNNDLASELSSDFANVLKQNAVPSNFNFPKAGANFLDYTEAKPTALTYDNYQNEQANTVWGKGHIEDMLRDNIFCIMWGGGSTTSISSESQDDGGYLNNALGDYMKGGAYTLTTGKVDASYSVSFKPTITPVNSDDQQLQTADKPVQMTFTVKQKGQYYSTFESTTADPFPLSAQLQVVLPSSLAADSANAYADWGSHKVIMGISGQNLPSQVTVGIKTGSAPAPTPGPGPKPHGGATAFKFTGATLFHNGSPVTGSFNYGCTPVDILGEYVPTATCTVTTSGADHIATVKNGSGTAVAKIILTALPQGLPANAYIPGIGQSADQTL